MVCINFASYKLHNCFLLVAGMITDFMGVSDNVGGSNFVFRAGTRPFESDSLMCLNITIIDDQLIEGEERFIVCGFSELSGVVLLGGGCTDVFIEDNDAGIERCSVYKEIFCFNHKINIQWSLPIKDTLGARLLAFIWKLSSGGRFEPLL